jgi:pimeloyl-ACP methyl ester carboxylesterase
VAVGPIFAAGTPWRLAREIEAALPDIAARRLFKRRMRRAFLQARVSPSRMARRALAIESHDRRADCAAVSCPTLIIHGDPALDHVVHAAGTSEYAQVIPGAQRAVLEGTGHLGCITKPGQFAGIIRQFVAASVRDGRHSAA